MHVIYTCTCILYVMHNIIMQVLQPCYHIMVSFSPRLLQQCFGKSSKADVSELWAQSGLSWVSLGLEEEEVEDFLSQEVRVIPVCYSVLVIVSVNHTSFLL